MRYIIIVSLFAGFAGCAAPEPEAWLGANSAAVGAGAGAQDEDQPPSEPACAQELLPPERRFSQHRAGPLAAPGTVSAEFKAAHKNVSGQGPTPKGRTLTAEEQARIEAGYRAEVKARSEFVAEEQKLLPLFERDPDRYWKVRSETKARILGKVSP